MDRDLSFQNLLKDLGMRIGAAAVVLGIFFGLGYATQTDFLGASSFLGNQASFFVATFLLIGIASLVWIVFQRYR